MCNNNDLVMNGSTIEENEWMFVPRPSFPFSSSPYPNHTSSQCFKTSSMYQA